MKRVASSKGVWLFLFQLGVLTAAAALWWSSRHNSLEGNGRWTVGKDTGKFVFQTFSFLSKPIQKNRVQLTHNGGFQELRYKRGDSETDYLSRVEFEVLIPDNSYIWLELQAHGHAMLAYRISSLKGYPSVAVQHDASGQAVEEYKVAEQLPPHDKHGWRILEAVRSGDEWVINLQGREMARLPVMAARHGQVGLRGPGNPNALVLLRRGVFEYTHRTSGKVVREVETFEPDPLNAGVLLGAFMFSFLSLGVRFMRTRALAGYLDHRTRPSFVTLDQIGLCVSLVPALFFYQTDSGMHILAGFLLAELISLVGFARNRRNTGNVKSSNPWLIGYTCFMMGVLAIAGYAHGEWLGRARESVWMQLRNVDPSTFIKIPSVDTPSAANSLESPVELQPGVPYIAEGYFYRQQQVLADFVIPTNSTVDLVFQLQSYKTRGDPEGESLPLQRRLVRLSTHPKVPMGLAIRAQTTPSPFVALKGSLHAGELNQVKLESTDEGVRIWLNGTETSIPGASPLGFGESGLLVLEGQIQLTRFDVKPMGVLAQNRAFQAVVTAVVPLLLGLLVWGCIRVGNRGVGFKQVLGIEFLVCFALVPYLVGSLFFSLEQLAFLGRSRLESLDLALITLALAHFFHLCMYQRPLRGGALYSNLILLVSSGLLVLFIWDLLPAKHPLRLKFTKEAFQPGEVIRSNTGRDTGPWYANDRIIGANTYFWKQQLGGKRLQHPKPSGVIRLFAMGGSQAWGSGAASTAETYDQLLEKELQAKGYPVEVYNAGINGAGVSKVLFLYRGLIEKLEPDILILDIGLNDSAAIRQSRGLESKRNHVTLLLKDFDDLLKAAKEQGVDVILSLEAMAGETPLTPNAYYYEQAGSMAEAYGFKVLNAMPHMLDLEQKHFVWWDPAHYTPYGHYALARFLLPTVEEAVKARVEGPDSP